MGAVKGSYIIITYLSPNTCELAHLIELNQDGLYISPRSTQSPPPVLPQIPSPFHPSLPSPFLIMVPERPPSRSEQLLRSALERNPHPHNQLQSSPRAHRRRHSHVPAPTTTNTEEDDQLYRAAFLYRTAATASSPIRPQFYSRHSPSPSRPASPSPSSRRQSLQRSPASDGNLSLQRHNSIPARKKPSSLVAEPLPLTPHEQVLRARLERVLIAGRVVDEKERSRERRPRSRDHYYRDDVPGWPWSDNQSMVCAVPPSPFNFMRLNLSILDGFYTAQIECEWE